MGRDRTYGRGKSAFCFFQKNMATWGGEFGGGAPPGFWFFLGADIF